MRREWVIWRSDRYRGVVGGGGGVKAKTSSRNSHNWRQKETPISSPGKETILKTNKGTMVAQSVGDWDETSPPLMSSGPGELVKLDASSSL